MLKKTSSIVFQTAGESHVQIGKLQQNSVIVRGLLYVEDTSVSVNVNM